MATKDEALKILYEAVEKYRWAVGNDATQSAWQDVCDFLDNECKEALEQPTMTYEQGFDHGYEAHRVEQELEQPAQEPVAWYGKDTAFSNENKIFVFNNKDDANAYGLRKSVSIEPLYTHPAPQQEPVAIVYSMQDGYIGQMVVKDIPHKTKLYTHPAPSWQRLSDDEVVAKVFENDELLARILYLNGASKALKRALKEKNNA